MKQDGGYDAIIDRDQASPVSVHSILILPAVTGYTMRLRFKKHAGVYSTGVYAYIIKPQGAKKLIDYVYEHGFRATDNQVGTIVLDVKVCIPSVARLHPVMKSRKIIGNVNFKTVTQPTHRKRNRTCKTRINTLR
jgi:GR25 family glycosyltransferase involved in LPS biosynthesis